MKKIVMLELDEEDARSLVRSVALTGEIIVNPEDPWGVSAQVKYFWTGA